MRCAARRASSVGWRPQISPATSRPFKGRSQRSHSGAKSAAPATRACTRGAARGGSTARGRVPWPGRRGRPCRAPVAAARSAVRTTAGRGSTKKPQGGQEGEPEHGSVRGDDVGAAGEPRPPLRLRERPEEPAGLPQVRDQQEAGDARGRRARRATAAAGGAWRGEPAARAGTRNGRPRSTSSRGTPRPSSPRSSGAARAPRRCGAARPPPRSGASGRGLRGLRPHVVGRRRRRRGHEGRRVALDVEDLGPRPLLGLAHLHGDAAHQVDDRRGGVVEVAGHDRLRRADGDARRLEPHLDLVRAEVALGRGLRAGVDVERVVGAALHAGLAADAAAAVEVHDPVLPPEERGGGADLDAGRVVAVVAAGDREGPPRLGELALLDVLDPGAGDPEGHLVLDLARHGARVAADALRLSIRKA